MRRPYTFSFSLALALAFAFAFASTASAKTILRMATVVPDGTGWARELRGFASEVASATQNDIAFKFYFGGIAGDDLQQLERIKRDQLDGSGAVASCETLAPSLRVGRLPGLYDNRDELRYVAGALRPTVEQEFAAQGFTFLGHTIAGQIMIASRKPMHDLAELKKTRMWTWDLDSITQSVYHEMGLTLVPAPVDSASSMYTDGKLDGFLAMPSAMLAFQWSAQARYVTDVRSHYMIACLFLTAKSMNKLPLAHQQVIRAATAKLSARLEAIGAEQDEKLMGGLFGHQGLEQSPVNEQFRSQFSQEAKAASERLGEKLVPAALFKRANELLKEYRSTHPTQAHR